MTPAGADPYGDVEKRMQGQLFGAGDEERAAVQRLKESGDLKKILRAYEETIAEMGEGAGPSRGPR